MSARCSELSIVAPSFNLDRFISSSSSIVSSPKSTTKSSVRCFDSPFLCCCLLQQGTFLCFRAVSMRLRPRRTCSGVECFGGFHIQRFSSLFLFFRETLT